jgi:hypothetical protein
LPNAVIYGWIDKTPIVSGGCQSGGIKAGCAHVVKVTAYAPGRCGNQANGTGGVCGTAMDQKASPTSPYIDSTLPWIKTSLKCSAVWSLLTGYPICFRIYDLRDRDEHVYIKVQRWDQDHTNNALTFPNQLPLWTMSFQNPKTATAFSGGLPSGWNSCMGLPALSGSSTAGGTGFGLTQQMFTALQNYSQLTSATSQPSSVLPKDATALGQSFMLNDEGVGSNAGAVDTYAAPSSPYNGQYKACLQTVNSLLSTGLESHACAAYVATDRPGASTSNQTGENNYKLFFEQCPSTPPDDLTGGGQ